MINANTIRELYDTSGDTVGNDRLRCNELLSELSDDTRKSRLVELFHKALIANATFDNVEQPFVKQSDINARHPLGPNSRGDNYICYLLSLGNVLVADGPVNYSFTYVSRKIPPRRIEGGNAPKSGAGGIDYTGITVMNPATPVIGEIKKTENTPFSAFIQVLTYLSEIATENQIRRANKHNEFGIQSQFPQPFDLHILLVDQNERSERMDLIESTCRLAKQFKTRLRTCYPMSAAVIGNVLCLRMNTANFAQNGSRTLECAWAV